MEVWCDRRSTIKLLWVASRCGTTIKAIPLAFGIAEKKLLNASSPPAEATSPTTGKRGAVEESLNAISIAGESSDADVDCSPLVADELASLFLILFDINDSLRKRTQYVSPAR